MINPLDFQAMGSFFQPLFQSFQRPQVGVRWGGAAEEDLRCNFDDVVGSAEELRAILAKDVGGRK